MTSDQERRPAFELAQYGDTACEIVLWSTWTHMGALLADVSTETVAVDAERFNASSSLAPDKSRACRTYASRFVEEAKKLLDNGAGHVLDVAIPRGTTSGLVQDSFETVLRMHQYSAYAGMPNPHFVGAIASRMHLGKSQTLRTRSQAGADAK